MLAKQDGDATHITPGFGRRVSMWSHCRSRNTNLYRFSSMARCNGVSIVAYEYIHMHTQCMIEICNDNDHVVSFR